MESAHRSFETYTSSAPRHPQGPTPGGRNKKESGAASVSDRTDPTWAEEMFKRIERSIAYMARHVDSPLQVATLAAVASVSQSHYFALFKQQTGMSPIDFFTRLKMRRARRLLDSTSLSVKEVAAALGYDDPFYFSRVFKSVHDVAPSEYRLLPPQLKVTPEDTNAVLPEPTKSAASPPDGGPGARLSRKNVISPPARHNYQMAGNR